jgi:hypothetical protein
VIVLDASALVEIGSPWSAAYTSMADECNCALVRQCGEIDG